MSGWIRKFLPEEKNLDMTHFFSILSDKKKEKIIKKYILVGQQNCFPYTRKTLLNEGYFFLNYD